MKTAQQKDLNEKNQEQVNGPAIYGVPDGYDAFVIGDLARQGMPDKSVHVHVVLDDARLMLVEECLSFFAPDCDIVSLPAWDCLPYDRVSPNGDIVAHRVDALSKLLDWQDQKHRKPRVLLLTINAALQKVMPQDVLRTLKLDVEKGQRLDVSHLQDFLHINGYSRTDTVREAGEYAIRGGIVDIFPSGNDKPYRLDLFGDEVESIKVFDPLSQRSDKSIKSFSLRPATEYTLSTDMVQKFRAGYREAFGAIGSDDPLYAAITEGRKYNGMDHWLPLFYDHMETVFDYIPNITMTCDFHVGSAAEERINHIQDFYQARKTLETAAKENKSKAKKDDTSLAGTIYHPITPNSLYLTQTNWTAIGTQYGMAALVPFAGTDDDAGGKKGRDFSDIRALPDGDVMGALRDYIRKQVTDGRQVVIASYSNGARDRLISMLDASGIENIKPCDTFEDVKRLKLGQIAVVVLALEKGFVSPDYAVLTEQDILGDRLTRKSKKKRKSDQFLTEVSSLAPGDLVVHVDHGIGRFEKLETLKASGVVKDCLQLIYDGGDKLYIPVENIEVLSRFGHDEGIVALDKLGGAGWQARKSKVKKDLMKIAGQLLEIAAARELRKGEKLHVNDNVYQEFAARFPYHETEDQRRAINDTLESLNSGRPMDRLICGDVGFGKTEVAIRAAYVAAMSGVQVAVVVPTTLLARQHYKNFVDRFKGTGLRVEQLSRLVSARDAKLTKDGLAEGSVNIVIGTHALLAQSIKFAHLGLMIIDEEQKFGVKQKERLKEMRADVHVLTMTATPIPRTLQLSLTGVKEMSLIATPPVDRLAIRTFVLPFDPVVIREAIMREYYRGGQIFYVCPRIKDLKDVEDNLKELVPEIKVVTAHGQMSPSDLEDRMNAFYDGQYNLLLATNIIESGLDIPTANTMIVHRSEMFGLAQLYQIRGRIGRSKTRAYAYLTFEPNKKLTDSAQKRLEVIETLDTLGAGFQLASHDMDIRGAGNLLGEEQSGHIKEVGVELYQQMLEDAVAAAKHGAGIEDDGDDGAWSPQINVGISVLIPETYVEDLGLRMSLYRRLSTLETKDDIELFAAEMIDRFGEFPDEVENLLQIVAIKQLCKKAGVDKVEAGPKGVVIGFHNDSPPNLQGLVEWMAAKKGTVSLRSDQKLVIMRFWEKAKMRMKGVENLMKELVSL